MCAIDDAESWACYTQKTPRAKKTWRCGECNRLIQPGEVYHLMEGKLQYEGEWSTHRTCEHCDAAAQWLITVCRGWVYNELYSELREHWEEGYTSVAFGRLIAGVRLRWHGGQDPIPDRLTVRAMAEEMMQEKVYPPSLRMAN